MYSIVCLIIALVMIAGFAFYAFKNRHNTQKCIASITLGVLFATFFMVLPTQWVKEGKEVFCEPLYAVLSSLLYSLKATTGRQDIAQLETMVLPPVLKGIYIVLGYICFALAPILASGLILTFVGDTGEKIRFMLQRSPKCYIFSEINENALALVEGIKNKEGKKTILFCNGKNTDKAVLEKAKKGGAIVLYKPCDSFTVSSRFKAYEFFLISENEDENIRLAEALVAKHADNKTVSIIINAFTESGTNVNLLEDTIKRKKTNIELRCIDEIALFCNQLIYKHPLYDPKGNRKHISVAIVGCGRTGMRMLKTVYWAGQIDGYSLKIRVYDKEAEACQTAFYKQCPGLKGEKAIRFVQADVHGDAFAKQLLAEDNSSDATYIVVAMGDDGLNLSVAEELYRIYRQHFEFHDNRMPEIFTRVRSQEKSDNYLDNPAFLETRHIHLFGTTAAIFSDKNLFDTELENLAFAVHLAYAKALNSDKTSEEYQKAYMNFKTGEYNRRGSMAAALHIPAKLHMCIPEATGNILTQDNMQRYADRIKKDKVLCDRLAQNEHARWNAFSLSEGYQAATIQQMHLYAKQVDDHKDKLSMLHPCIVPWEALDDVKAIYNSTYNKSEDFKNSDIEIVKKIPSIWSAAQKMNKENHDV